MDRERSRRLSEGPRTTEFRTTARAVGGLFVLATVTAIIGGSLIAPIEDEADIAALRGQVSTGALLEVVLALSVIAIAVLLVPVLRRQHEGAALGYAAIRTVEGVFVLMATTSALLAVALGQDAPVDLLLAARDWTYLIGTVLVFSTSALLLNVLLYPGRLVPRWLSGWGIVGAVLLLTRGVLELYGVESSFGAEFVWAATIALQEMVLAGWLIVRGFDTSRLPAETTPATPASPSPPRPGPGGRVVASG